VYDSLLDETETGNEDASPATQAEKQVASNDNPLATSVCSREHGVPLSIRDVWGDFRNN
jgi:hypothetical protein